MFRPTNLATLVLLIATAATGQNGRPDFVLNRTPFHEWLKQSEQAHIHWSVDIAPVTLSSHQRLSSQIRFVIDGGEITKRLGKGELMMFIEIEDEHHQLWQDHDSLDLKQFDLQIHKHDLQFVDKFFVRPGSYRGSFAIYDTATGEHSVIRRNFHASALHGDPFAASWDNLPAIEYVNTPGDPASWYLPGVHSRLAISAKASQPTTLDVILNVTPSERLSGSASAQSRGLAVLIPSLKVLSEVNWQNVRLNISLVDIAHQRIAWQQDDTRRVNWRQLTSSLGSANPGMIDVQALSGQKRQANFFISAVQKRIRAATGSRAIVILSAPVDFEHGQEMHPIAAAPERDLRTYYVRYLPRVPFNRTEMYNLGEGEYAPFRKRDVASLVDQLEPLLKPVAPKLFDVTTPEEFRHALAAIIADISRN